MSIHDHLTHLSPIAFTDLPTDDAGIAEYIKDELSYCQQLVDSVPPAPQASSPAKTAASSSNIASLGSEMTTTTSHVSDASYDPELRKAWGKPLKLSEKDNPMNIAVYKMAAKDRNGAWFARRSVHEGMGFARWKKCLDSEFEESLKVPGKPGEGNVRGIGGEEQIMRKTVPGVGEMHVMHLTAQFPGPSSPRDFVELLVSTTTHPDDHQGGNEAKNPSQYLLISRPIMHPDVPEKSGLVRGKYESVEFIREIPIKKTKAVGTGNVPATVKAGVDDKDAAAGPRDGGAAQEDTSLLNAKGGKITVEDAQAKLEADHAHGKEVLLDSEKGDKVDVPVDEDGELAANPVEWIMITRSDPGGSVPKFMVERGTPSAIVSDAGKFLIWAAAQDTTSSDEVDEQASLPPTSTRAQEGDVTSAQSSTTTKDSAPDAGFDSTTAATPANQGRARRLTRTMTAASTSSTSSSDSFVSAGSGTPTVIPSSSGLSTKSSRSDKYEYQKSEIEKKMQSRKALADAKLAEKKSKHGSDEQKIAKAEGRRSRKHSEADSWFEKELSKVQSRRAKDERKQAARERKELEKAESSDIKAQVEKLKQENEQLRAELEKSKAGQ